MATLHGDTSTGVSTGNAKVVEDKDGPASVS